MSLSLLNAERESAEKPETWIMQKLQMFLQISDEDPERDKQFSINHRQTIKTARKVLGNVHN